MRSYFIFSIATYVVFFIIFLFNSITTKAEVINTSAKQAIVVAADTNTVLMEKNADELMTPSSMSKLMTIYMIFERLKDGSLKMTDELPVSETSWKRNYKSNGSLMFLSVNSMVTVSDLLRGIIIQSGNDACSVLAESLYGSEDAFAELANQKSREIGMTKSTFKNSSGWPTTDHQMTSRDLSILAQRLIIDFPDYYPIFSEKSFIFNKIRQDNRNPLIWQNVTGADGLKTGYTENGGYGEVGSALRNGRRIIVVLNGMNSIKTRAEETIRLLEWAFREFDNYTLFRAGEIVTNADVWLGKEKTVPVYVARDLIITLQRTTKSNMKITASFNGSVKTPIKSGSEIGVLTVTAPNISPIQVPLLASVDVEQLGFFGRINAFVKQTLWGD
ncbi:MAG: D-alanyl-D-alanine carboxypeptidase [Rhodospirillaceae bacterium]|nr:D-alanyl-D-alanine carboxypeptidase [Rhodospirillaceae bacterium]